MLSSLLLVLLTAVALTGAQQPASLRIHPAKTDDDADPKLRAAPLPDSVASPPASAPGDSYSPFGIDQTVFDLVLSKLKERHDAMTALGNDTAKWKNRQSEVRASLRELFAPLPPANRSKTPRSVDGGIACDCKSTNGDGFVLKKLLVETRPGYYASAGLFLPPGKINKSVPAVLFPSGHSTLTWREPANQLIAANLVKRGIAVLGYDPIGQGERRMLPDLDGSGGSLLNGTESFGCSMEHEYVQRVSTLNGINAASSWVWDMMVLTDFLETHPMIDPKRLAVAGCSGGGVQSAYLGSIDERLVAASIACYTSTLTVDYAPSTGLSFIGGGGPAEGEQQWGPLVGVGTMLDKPDLLTVRAPHPTQVLLTTRDQYFPLVGGKAAVAEAMPAFEALAPSGSPAALTMTVGNNSHGYINKTRLALYKFMSKHLLGVVDSGVELQLPAYLPFDEMRVTTTGSVLTAPELNNGQGSVSVHDAFLLPTTLRNLAQLEGKRKSDQRGFLANIAGSCAEVVGFVNVSAIKPAVRLANGTVDNGTTPTPRFSLPGEGRCNIGLEVLPATGHVVGNQSAAVMYVSRKGSTLARPRPGQLSEAEQVRLAAVRASGLAVVLVDVCGFGTLADKAGDAFGLFDVPSRAYRTKESHPVDAMYNVGRSIVGLHAGDVTRAARWVDESMHLKVVATLSANETSAAVLAAALIAKTAPTGTSAHGATALGAVALLSSVASWSEFLLSPRYDMTSYYSFVFGALKHFDLPDMAAALGVPVLVAQPLDALHVPLNATRAAATFAFAAAGNARVAVKVGGSADDVTQALLSWLVEA